MKHINIFLSSLMALLCFSGVTALKAEIITFSPAVVLGNGAAPGGQAPWITAIFDDHGQPGSVTLTLSCVNLTDSEFVSKWLFNLDPEINPRQLTFSSLVKTGSFAIPSIFARRDLFRGGGGDKFDISFDFSTKNAGSKRFDDFDCLQLVISGDSSLTAESFDFDSQGKPHRNVLLAETKAHIQGIGRCGHGSAWIASLEPSPIVPEPSPLVLVLCGLLGMTLYNWRQRKINFE